MRLTYRAASTADHSFIAATWSTCWGRPPEASLVTPAAWRTAVWSSVPALLERPDVRVLVAADADSATGDADLFGWLAWKPRAVECVINGYTRRPSYRLADADAGDEHRAHRRQGTAPMPLVFCVYVKRDARKNGIARGLLRAADLDPRADFAHVCHTRVVGDLADKIPNAVWCPHLGRPPQEKPAHGQQRSEAVAAEPDAA